eukprot:CAMPEP_0182856256 /NCGR_PEP_ID=MMETSP0034_2-20130328/2323_1 /TAXON_ID=156128 /ORGANISM="Nephroselmis pyriformis, Strain CCMP717" /LENGTH=708 /DNA_ID=CAMNT_0024987311 /DNA_START=113 /DNA_END=2235 /DNA_ORIENTATION=-
MTLSIRSQPRLAAHARPTRALRLQRSAGVLLGARPIGVPPSTSRATKPALTTARVSEPETRKGSVKEMSSQMKDMRAQMEENEDLSVLMRGLRGTNIDESDFAASDVKMQLVDVGKYASQDGDATDSLPQEYDPEIIAAYWGRRPGAITTRIFQLMGIAGGFLGGLALDAARGKVRENEVKRAIQLRNIITSLGPAYIKLGQALAIRPDILSPAAMNELQKLCDKVPSFDSTLAMQFIEEELGAPWTEFYSELTPEPVAAASLGQVYKGRLKTGEQVAVKVQRPYVLETVTIDLYILRRIGFALRKVDGVNTDIVGLLDEWAERFFEELDYVREGNNATKFAEQMKDDLPQIVVPMTYPEFTSRRVLTSGWLDGEKLSQSTADDVGQLVSLGVICYLKQLLDTGFFHADPHPGNLIRTPDGRLAILDFGLMTEVDDDIKYGMIEAISHLIHRDYEAIVEDFVTLDFIPDGVDLKPILPVLAKVFDSALEGGGAKNFNFQELAADLAQITFDYPFRIPPYFALIIRAIGVLEGIALVGNPDFALVDEAYPYISKRLLTDDSPRLRQSLRYMVYGRGKVFDAERLIDILEAFEEFSKASKSAYGNLGVPLPTAEHAAHSEDAAHSSKDAAASAKKSKETQRLRGGIPGLVAVPSPFGGSVLVPKDLVPAGFPTTSVSAAGGGGDMVDLPSPFGGTVQVPRALVPPGVSIP